MNIYFVTSPVTVRSGLLLLEAAQAKSRNHVLVKQDVSIKSLKLSDDEKEFLNADDKDTHLAVYKVIGETQFKVGEKIGYDGELNKAMAETLTPASEADLPDEETAEVDQELVNAIIELDPENDAHWSSQDKPEIAVLTALVGRKVTGKERDEAFAVFNEQQAALVELISEFDPEDATLWTDEQTPDAGAVSLLAEREVSQKETDLAFAAYESLKAKEADD